MVLRINQEDVPFATDAAGVQQIDFVHGSPAKALLRYAWPQVIGLGLHALMSLTCVVTLQAAGLQLSGYALADQIAAILGLLTVGIAIGTAIELNRNSGPLRFGTAIDYAHRAMSVVVASATIVTVVLFTAMLALQRLFNDATTLSAIGYLEIWVWTIPLLAISAQFSTHIRASGSVVYTPKGQALGLLVHLALCPSLAIGLDMGVDGCAWSWLIAQAVAMVYLARVVGSGRLLITVRWRDIRPKFGLAGHALRRLVPGMAYSLTGAIFLLWHLRVARPEYHLFEQITGFGTWVDLVLRSTLLALPISLEIGASMNHGAGRFERMWGMLSLARRLQGVVVLAVTLLTLGCSLLWHLNAGTGDRLGSTAFYSSLLICGSWIPLSFAHLHARFLNGMGAHWTAIVVLLTPLVAIPTLFAFAFESVVFFCLSFPATALAAFLSTWTVLRWYAGQVPTGETNPDGMR